MVRLDWTPEMDAQVKRLWERGWPARRIAAKIGATKNSVIGRAFRQKWVWGLHRPTHTPRPSPRPPGSPPTLLDLKPHQCKWPMNAPDRGGTYLFCGSPQFNGSRYCEDHHRLGYQKGSAPRGVTHAAWVHKPMVTG